MLIAMPRTVGFFHFRIATPDDVWNQCDGPLGRHGDLRFALNDSKADHVLCLGLPITPSGEPRHRGWARRWSRLRGRYELDRARVAFRALGRSKRDVTVLFLEPASNIPTRYYDAAREFADRVHAPDPRAPIPTRLPVWWWVDEPISQLRHAPTPALADKPVPLVAITSGKRDLAGHAERLDFIRAVRGSGVDLPLFGRNLPSDLAPHSPLRAKSLALHSARFALVLENDATGDLYASEKLWDALLCWCLPLYHGSRAADSMIPAEAFMRVPDLGATGISAVRDAMSNPRLWEDRLPAIAEARRRILGELRLVEWVRRMLP
jgi:hypothetical protein